VRVIEALRRDPPAVWHIHGDWDHPESIVFSQADYDRIVAKELPQFVQQTATLGFTLVFVGCSGSGLSDDNVGRLPHMHPFDFAATDRVGDEIERVARHAPAVLHARRLQSFHDNVGNPLGHFGSPWLATMEFYHLAWTASDHVAETLCSRRSRSDGCLPKRWVGDNCRR